MIKHLSYCSRPFFLRSWQSELSAVAFMMGWGDRKFWNRELWPATFRIFVGASSLPEGDLEILGWVPLSRLTRSRISMHGARSRILIGQTRVGQ